MDHGVTSWKDLVELVSFCVVILGVPAAVFQYVKAKRREQKDREYGTYDELDNKYVDYQRVCLEHPRLDVWDIPDPEPKELSPEEVKQEQQLFTILFAIFERAFLMYSDMSTELRRTQWTGWDQYIQSFCERANFCDAWKKSGSTFDLKFEQYMVRAIAPAGNR